MLSYRVHSTAPQANKHTYKQTNKQTNDGPLKMGGPLKTDGAQTLDQRTLKNGRTRKTEGTQTLDRRTLKNGRTLKHLPI